MNTLIHLWIKPLIMNHERSKDKIYINCIIEGDYADKHPEELDHLIEGEIMANIMDYANIESNWDFACLLAKRTNKKPSIELTVSAAEKKMDNKLKAIIKSKKDIPVQEKDVDIKEGGLINISFPSLNIKETINFPKIWESIEKNFLGKIKEGDNVKLLDDDGNVLFEIMGGQFINAALGDLVIKGSDGNIKGGVFLRKDGSLDVGDFKRTFYLRINTRKLLKTSLKLKTSLMELTQQKLLGNG